MACCGPPKPANGAANGAGGGDDTGLQLKAAADGAAGVREAVSTYYGETLQSTTDLKTSACTTCKAPPAEVLAALREVPEEVTARYYGCGSPFPAGLKGSGLRVLDLGCGTGRDCFVAAALVGPTGCVTGVDMTPAQLEVARRHAPAWAAARAGQAAPLAFVDGEIERLGAAGVAPGSVDLAISNCVINLSADKPAVLRGVWDALADGGEFYFSDVYADRRLPAAARTDAVALGECLGGALHVNDLVRAAQAAGFTDPRALEAAPIDVHDARLRELLGPHTRFFSVTFRLFKVTPPAASAAAATASSNGCCGGGGGGGGGKNAAAADVAGAAAAVDFLEPGAPEDYGQTATYLGGLSGGGSSSDGDDDAYVLDFAHTYKRGQPVRVCGNTAALLSRTWLRRHFEVTPRGAHRGQFACAPGACGGVDAATVAAIVGGGAGAAAGGACCPPPKEASAAAAAGGGGGGCCGGGKGGCC